MTRALTFVVAFAVGMVPAFTPPEDSSELFVLHPSTVPLGLGSEPQGRDRISLLREEAERYGARGKGPCLWYRVANLERVLGQTSQAARDDAHAKNAIPKERCPKLVF